MRRYKEPAFAVACIALLASLCVHLPAYGVLGVIAKNTDVPTGPRRAAEDTLVWLDLGEPVPAPPVETPPETPVETPPRPRPRPLRVVPERVAVAEPERAEAPPEPTPVIPVPTPPTPVAPPPPPPETVQNMQSVEQTTDTPAEEAPEDAQFLAEQNNRVEEETMAELRNSQEDQRDPQAAASESEAPPTPDEGTDSPDSEVADLREVTGSDARHPTVAETRQPPPRTPTDATPAASRLPNEPQRGASESSSAGGQGVAGERRPNTEDHAPEARTEVITITDGSGTFRIERIVPTDRDGDGQPRSVASRGGVDDDERGQTRGEGSGRTRGDGDGRPQGSATARGRNGPNLRIGFSQFQQVMGEDVLREEREARFAEERSRRAGQSHAARWQQFRAAIENYTPSVRPGNQTALNTRASPFASYLAAVHRRIHREFADGFLQNSSRLAGVPAAGGHITSVLEIVFNPDGTLHRVGIARTSGVVLFDHGAYASVINAQPFPAPPAAIQSGDGRVYVHWGFHSNELACGTFNAQPYIIPSPPDTEPTILDATRPPSRTVRAAPDDDGPLDDPTTPQDESDGT